jgi:ribosomal protein S21
VAEIRLQEGESLENALRRFKRKVQPEDIIKEVKRHIPLPAKRSKFARLACCESFASAGILLCMRSIFNLRVIAGDPSSFISFRFCTSKGSWPTQ